MSEAIVNSKENSFSIDWLLEYYALAESSESRAGKTPVLCDLYSNERDKSLHHDMKLST